MAIRKINRLAFDRNHDPFTKFYRVYRSTNSNVSRNAVHVMDILHPASPSPIAVQGEVLRRITTLQFDVSHAHLFLSTAETPLIVYVNGIEATRAGYTYLVDYKRGIIQFQKAPGKLDVITLDYFFDGLHVLDSDTPQDSVKAYYGPVAYDNIQPAPPISLQLQADETLERALLAWSPGSLPGEMYYYRVEATDGENFSQLSTVAISYLAGTLANQGYAVERSWDQQKWEIVGRTDLLNYTDFDVNRTPPNPVQFVSASVSANPNQGAVNISLSWMNPTADPVSASPYYRLRAVSALNAWSDPSEVVGPVYLQSKVTHIVIRRKIQDGTIPTFSDSDAVTVATLTDPALQFYQDVAPDGEAYTYALFRVDTTGRYSLAGTVSTPALDATPPAKVTGLTLQSQRLIY